MFLQNVDDWKRGICFDQKMGLATYALNLGLPDYTSTSSLMGYYLHPEVYAHFKKSPPE
jgi:hypothetical protein